MLEYYGKWINILSLVIAFYTTSNCQPVPCDDRLYLFHAEQASRSSTLSQVMINPSTGRTELQILKTDISTNLNASGYNVFDGYIYGLNPITYELFRVDATGNATNLGVPTNIDKSLTYNSGAISPNGKTLIAVGRTKDTGIDKRILSVNLDRMFAGYVSIISDVEVQIGDIAFDPELGTLVGFDEKNKRLVNISSGGLVTSNRFEVNPTINRLGSLFFNANLELYAYGGTSIENTFYKIDKYTGKAKEIGNGSGSRVTDGCSCPYRITFDKTVTPSKALPCTEVIYRYHIKNTAGTAFTQINIRDTFPEDFVITEVGKVLIGEVASGVGSNILHITQMHLILGNNDIEVKVRVGSRPGQYPSKTQVGPLPFIFGGAVISDDPRDGLIQSPTVLTIIKGPELIEEEQLYLCPGGTRTLGANFSADEFLWNTGVTNANLEVSEPGIYTVIASTICGDFFDTVKVESVPSPLTVSLGEDQVIEQGDQLTLNANISNNEPVYYNWQANGDSTLSCTNCSHPTAQPLFNSIYKVTITDENGCTASDELFVEVIPVRNIFAPTAFSPNNDGINDIFYLQGKSNAKILYLRIFDRWGNQVFQIQNGVLNDESYGWDGKITSKSIASQAFVYITELEFPDGNRKRLQGEVSLIR